MLQNLNAKKYRYLNEWIIQKTQWPLAAEERRHRENLDMSKQHLNQTKEFEQHAQARHQENLKQVRDMEQHANERRQKSLNQLKNLHTQN